MCGRQLRRPSPDGLGPKCRRATRPQPAAHATTTPATAPLDHDALAAAGQTTIPLPGLTPPEVPARRRRGRGTTTLPDLSTYQPTET